MNVIFIIIALQQVCKVHQKFDTLNEKSTVIFLKNAGYIKMSPPLNMFPARKEKRKKKKTLVSNCLG